MSDIKIIALGGVRENGKNLYIVEVEEEIYILDCGLIYPENELLGIDVVIPDFSYLEENSDRIVGVFLTHGHADAIGALPYFLQKFSVPVFGTELTIALAKLFVEKDHISKGFDDYHIIDENTEIEFGNSVVSFFKTTHTIPDSVGIAVKTDEGSIVYTGDFKFDQSAIPMYQTNFAKISSIGENNVLALLSDSEGAESTVENASDLKIAGEVLDTFRNTEGRIIAACVASNILRVQQVLNAAEKSKRKVFITGKDLEEIVKTAMKLNKIELPSDELIVPVKDIDNYPDNEIVVLETGNLGEPIQSLQKMALGRHRQVNIKEGDLIYITTTTSTAMETTVAKTEDMIYRAGGTVKQISDNLKASGHGSQKDLQLMINLMKPTYFIPVKGQFRLLSAHAELANEVGIPHKNIFIPGKGDVMEYKDGRMRMAGQVEAGNTMIDGIGIGDIGNIVLRDRKLLSEDGIFVAVVTISRKQGKIISGPDVTTKGFVYVRANEDLIKESNEIVRTVVEENLSRKEFEWSRLKQEIREALSKYLFEKTRRRPVILPIIMESSYRNKKRK
ncbi:RNase J family beta-CASP ribonuclease [Carnobacterium divergens]|uniref:ribonuclease J n=1 Tax=Carnobacterium divergens TaxID=2748 RepID=UPI000D45F3F6|nr:ribonuclease J [Carnobacterium divergens]MCO6017611.1 ribonuclease J [Carnobacterium divergens]TFI60966.1 RNase J family beta-CASP ribonuclease [Carnobacterium divergens]TFI87989.1 RNase J family beta-CASP ribonuclease [Carnobacterium divergens]TFJ02557.1 RNase J family beta-CASP ribonuclease [Carnobacterium divergens]TFJ04066.1 RNase J family beta-CASP ribonuclease [Carnobacterium divergens]